VVYAPHEKLKLAKTTKRVGRNTDRQIEEIKERGGSFLSLRRFFFSYVFFLGEPGSVAACRSSTPVLALNSHVLCRGWLFSTVFLIRELSSRHLLFLGPGSCQVSLLCAYHHVTSLDKKTGSILFSTRPDLDKHDLDSKIQSNLHSMTSIVLPGDQVPSSALPSATSKTPLRLGPGLRLLQNKKSSPQTTIEATHAGLLSIDQNRKAVSIQPFPNRRYIPTVNDLVIAQVQRSSIDFFHCIVTPHAPFAVLGQLAFEGASKKTRPNLKQGDLVYARVLSVGVGAGTEVELTCVNPATGKAEPGGLGLLSGGMVFDVSTGLAARLMKAGTSSSSAEAASVVILEELGSKFESKGGFEMAVGRNGKVWVDSSNSGELAVKITVAIGKCLRELDQRHLTPAEQRKLVTRVLRELNIDA
jgi:exosome complex component RRP40